MKKTLKHFLYLSFIILLSSCASTKFSAAEEQVAFEQIKKVLYTQQDAWNEGNLEKFMEGYWKSEDLSFIGQRGITKGWETTLANYKKGYPDLDAMGRLTFEILEMRAFSKTVCKMVGKYTLKRKEDMPSGHFTLIWEYIDGQWLISSDHTSG